MDIDTIIAPNLDVPAPRTEKSRHTRPAHPAPQVSRFIAADSEEEPSTMDGEDDDDPSMLGTLNRLVAQRQRPAQVASIASSQPRTRITQRELDDMRFYDDEAFNLEDHVTRRAIYRPSDATAPVVAGARDLRISAWNFTEKHFRVPGATQWEHLKREKLNLFCSIFAALAFACGKKEKRQAPEKVATARNTPRRRQSSADAQPGQQDDAPPQPAPPNGDAAPPQGENMRFLQGNDHASLFIETLVRQGLCVGFRLWLMETGAADSFFSLGLHESILEAADISTEVRAQLSAVVQGGPARKGQVVPPKAQKGAPQDATQYQVRREFDYARFTDAAGHFLNITKHYFCSDPCLTMDDGRGGGGGAVDATGTRMFRDDRDFMSFDPLVDRAYAGVPFSAPEHPCNMARLFCKEAAMLYYVCDERVDPMQCQLSSYVRNAPPMLQPGDDAQANREQEHMLMDEEPQAVHARERLNRALHQDCADRNFTGFPLPHITYHLPNAFFANDFMVRMPLPHQIGARLYTSNDRHALQRVFDERLPLRAPQQPPLLFGLHQSECELSSELLLYNAHHLDEVTVREVSRAQPSRQQREKFQHNMLNEINMRLKLILTNLGSLRGRIFITEINEAEHANSARRRQADALALTSSLLNYTNRAIPPEGAQALDVRHLPYLSLSEPGEPPQGDKAAALDRLKIQKIRELQAHQKTQAMMDEEKRYEELYYCKKVASGYVGFFRDLLEQYGPYEPTMETIRQLRQSGEMGIDDDDVTLRRNVFLRLNVLNQYRYQQYHKKHYDPKTGQIPAAREALAMRDLRELQDAMYVQFETEFFASPDVSMATLGIRADLQRKPIFFAARAQQQAAQAGQAGHAEQQLRQHRKRVGTQLPVYQYTQDVRPYGAFVTQLSAFIATQMGITHNNKIAKMLYFARGHHCRWHPQCNNPKLNFILSGNGMAGKSKVLQEIKKCCPSGVGDMVTHITDQAFNVDRCLDDILLIYEEFQNKFLGYSNGNAGKNAHGGGGGAGGVSAGSDKDTSNFFKARLTSGKTQTYSWFENEETGKRDVRMSQASVQGNLMGASNNDFSDADLNVLSRLILISVAKSKFDTVGSRPQDKTQPQMADMSAHDREMYEYHRELHRIYFLIEKMIQSGVLGDNVYGVKMDGVRDQINGVLDILQRAGIPTNDVRKREYVIEMTRCMALFRAVWFGLTSALTRDLQKDPFNHAVDIGFNPRVVLEGIVPFLVATKDEAIDACTSLSCLWYHDYQDLILHAFADKKCHLRELRKQHFLQYVKPGSETDKARQKNPLSLSRSFGGGGGGGGGGMSASASVPEQDRVVDYNYIVLEGRTPMDICALLSTALGEYMVAAQDIHKLLKDMSRASKKTYGYVLDNTGPRPRLRVERENAHSCQDRPVVEMTNCPLSGRNQIRVLVQFLRQKLPTLLHDVVEEAEEDDAGPVLALDSAQPGAAAAARIDEASDLARKLGEVNAHNETMVVRAIKEYYQNEVLENWHLPAHRALYESAARPDGRQPLLRFVTADAPPPVKLSQLAPELRQSIARSEVGDKDIMFTDTHLMLQLQPKVGGRKQIVHNYNTLTSSARSSLPIYGTQGAHAAPQQQERRGDPLLTKKRTSLYCETEAWEVDMDLDYVSCRVHMQDTGQRRLPSRPHHALINYPPSLYMALMEQDGLHASLAQYPEVDIKEKIERRKRRVRNEADPAQAQYASYDKFAGANFESGDAATGQSLFIGLPLAKPVAPAQQQQKRQKRRRMNEVQQQDMDVQ